MDGDQRSHVCLAQRSGQAVPEDGVLEQEEMGWEEERWEETWHWSEEAALGLMAGMHGDVDGESICTILSQLQCR